jgi:hypothetical protein
VTPATKPLKETEKEKEKGKGRGKTSDAAVDAVTSTSTPGKMPDPSSSSSSFSSSSPSSGPALGPHGAAEEAAEAQLRWRAEQREWAAAGARAEGVELQHPDGGDDDAARHASAGDAATRARAVFVAFDPLTGLAHLEVSYGARDKVTVQSVRGTLRAAVSEAVYSDALMLVPGPAGPSSTSTT